MSAKKKDFKHYGKIRHPARRVLTKIAIFIGCVFLFITLITSFFLDSVVIGSSSMEPTLSLGDRVLTSPLVFGAKVPFTTLRFGPTRQPERGELVICSLPFYETSALRRLAEPFISFFTLRHIRGDNPEHKEWEDSYFAKRVIGIPGDTVMIENFIAFVKAPGSDDFVNERVLSNRQYSITLTPLPEGWDPLYPFSGTTEAVTLGEDEYFVLGDNRSQSHDSRHFGPIRGDGILQKVMLRYFPLRKAGGI